MVLRHHLLNKCFNVRTRIELFSQPRRKELPTLKGSWGWGRSIFGSKLRFPTAELLGSRLPPVRVGDQGCLQGTCSLGTVCKQLSLFVPFCALPSASGWPGWRHLLMVQLLGREEFLYWLPSLPPPVWACRRAGKKFQEKKANAFVCNRVSLIESCHLSSL